LAHRHRLLAGEYEILAPVVRVRADAGFLVIVGVDKTARITRVASGGFLNSIRLHGSISCPYAETTSDLEKRLRAVATDAANLPERGGKDTA